MLARFKLLTYILIFLSIIGCDSESDTATYFGGKIINPKSDHVILYEREQAIDTFYLDKHNKFLSEINIAKEGIFIFRHGPEVQFMYLKPNDSVLIRLNTWDFDESLVFSGKGAKRNNVLIDCFLDSERDDKSFRKLYKLPSAKFRSKILALEQEKKDRLQELLMRFEKESEEFKTILEISLLYPVYRKLEGYPFYSDMKNATMNEKIDDDFYAHRKFVDYKKDSIMHYYAYRDYIVSYLYNTVLNNSGYQIYTDKFTNELLHAIDKHFNIEHTRNTLLRQTLISHFYRKSSCEVNKEAFKTFLKLTSNNEDVDLIKRLLNDTKKIERGKKLEDFVLTDLNDVGHSVKKLIKDKNIALYFWNSDYTSKEYLSSRINYFSDQYPNLEFIIININGKDKSHIKKLDIKSQYYIDTESEANEFLTSKFPRTILVDKNGVVVNAFASLSSKNFYNQVAGLAKN